MIFAIREKLKKLNFLPLEATISTLAKNDQSSFDKVFDNLSNAAYRISLRRSGAELDGGGGRRKTAPPPPTAVLYTIGGPCIRLAGSESRLIGGRQTSPDENM